MHEHQALTSGWQLLAAYNRLIENMHEMGHYHFEMLTLGYGAYLTFRDLCAELFPSIDNQTITRMVSGHGAGALPPRRGAAQAGARSGTSWSCASSCDGDPDSVLARLADERSRRRRVAGGLRGGQGPVVLVLDRRGLLRITDRAWMDDLRVPFAALRGYLDRLAGAARTSTLPTEALRAEGERLAAEYADTARLRRGARELPTACSSSHARSIPTSRTTTSTSSTGTTRSSSTRCASSAPCSSRDGLLADAEDIFYLHALRDPVRRSTSSGSTGRSTATRASLALAGDRGRACGARSSRGCRQWNPPPALGPPPEQITETLHDHAVGHHHRGRRRMAGRRRRARRRRRPVAAWHRRLAGRGRGPRARGGRRHAGSRTSSRVTFSSRQITNPTWAPIFNR